MFPQESGPYGLHGYPVSPKVLQLGRRLQSANGECNRREQHLPERSDFPTTLCDRVYARQV
ncbi:hypothetical protein AB205_0206160 [Aquarana catesbeiana]|uniref:Uncharacterized protein n=1 Tax=Aquarana catesbeiana TaxID=8400 RepID=A0A2G9RDF8_AQUCT|nr:hypothetical protein AB205_0206160 [Aquarana catesbeiana]